MNKSGGKGKPSKKTRKMPEPGEIKFLNRCYGYIRVSTKHQKDEGMSLENQEKKLQAWATINDHTMIEVIPDKGISGTSIERRPGLVRLLEIIKPGETLLTYNFSRLSRSARDFLNILHEMNMRGCRVVIMTENLDTGTPYGRFTATLFSAVAELEADVIRKRVQDSMDVKKEKGEFVGRIPYGWKQVGGKGSGLEEVPEQQKVISRIKLLRASFTVEGKQYSYEKIANVLNDEKIKPPGKSAYWTHTHISRIYNRGEVRTKGRSPTRARYMKKPVEEDGDDDSCPSEEESENEVVSPPPPLT